MGWGIDLWDRRPNIEGATLDSIEFIGVCKNMVNAVAAVEIDYAKAMRKALKPFYPVLQNDNTTEANAWKNVVGAFEGIAGAHDQMAESLLAEMNQPLDALVMEKRKQRDGYLKELAALDHIESKELAKLAKARKKYDKIEKDADDAEAMYAKAKKADNITLGKVEKLREAWEKKSRVRDAEEAQLKVVNDELNAFRTTHYHVALPAVIDQMQIMHEDRGAKVVARFSTMAKAIKDCEAMANEAIAALDGRIAAFSAVEDSKEFVRMYTSGMGPPSDLPLHPPGTPRAAKPAAGAQQAQAGQANSGRVQAEDAGEEDEPLPEMEQQQILCMYEFAGSNEGELACGANEWVGLVSNDGSGWILCSKPGGSQGYVPASYIDGFG